MRESRCVKEKLGSGVNEKEKRTMGGREILAVREEQV